MNDPLYPHINPDGKALNHDNPIVKLFSFVNEKIDRFFDTAEMNDWIEWNYTEEKPYPETLDTKLSMVRFRDGQESATCWTVEIWHGSGKPSTSNWANECDDSEIIAYKVAK